MNSKLPSPPSPLIGTVVSLIVVGLIFISLSTLSEASTTIGDKYFFIKKQAMWLGIGFISFLIFSKINLTIIHRYSKYLYWASIFFLIAVLIPKIGNSALGARRWLDIGIINIQPSEIVKFTSIIYFSALFSGSQNRTLKSLLVYLGIPFVLIILEPNLSTAILVSAIVISIYYLSGGEIISLFKLFAIGVTATFILIFVSPYRLARFQTLLHPMENETSSSYHRNQIILAISSGGFFGKGFANSDQKYRYLPKISTDSIFAVIGEETGFIGITTVFLIYLVLINHLFRLSQSTPDHFHSLLTSGIACWISYQCLINLSASSALIPLTGIPLPFISYGGSSLVTLLSAIGIVRNIEINYSGLVYSDHDRQKLNRRHHRISPHPRH